METIWKIKDCDMEDVRMLAYELDLPIPVAQVLVARNLDTLEKANDFLKTGLKYLHNPNLLPDFKPVINRLNKAIDTQ